MPTSESVVLNWGKRRLRLLKFALLLFSVTFALLLSEVALRLVGYSFPTFYTTDQERGFGLRPNTAGWYRREGETYVRINSAGLRDVEHAREKPPNTLRIAVVGDSYAEALQLPLEQTFWAVMGQRLKNCPAAPGRDIEVINFGVSGYGTAQEFITLQRDVFAYSPDIVLLSVTTNNDITDNSRALKRTHEIPYFVFREGRLALDDSFRNSRAFRLRASFPNRILTWFRDNSRLLQALHHAQFAFKNYLERRQARKSEQASSNKAEPQPHNPNTTVQPVVNPAEVGIDNLIYRPPLDSEWQEAWRVTEALIVKMRDEVKGHGAKFVVVVGSNGPQVLPDPASRSEIMARVGATDIFYPDARLRALGEREEILVITLAPELQAYAEQYKVYLHGFGAGIGNGHWNIEGHRVSGELLAQKLCDELGK